jgi:hypothetical protein
LLKIALRCTVGSFARLFPDLCRVWYSTERGEASAARACRASRLSPKVLEAIGRQLGVTHRVLNVLMPEISLQRTGVMAGIGKRVAAAMVKHVRMHWEWHLSPSADPAE